MPRSSLVARRQEPMAGSRLVLPKELKIAAYDYAVKHVKIPESDGCVGDFCSDTSTIRVTTGLRRKRAVETLLHEAMHAIWYSYTISNKDKEERTISVMSTAIAALLRDNPSFAKLLVEELTD